MKEPRRECQRILKLKGHKEKKVLIKTIMSEEENQCIVVPEAKERGCFRKKDLINKAKCHPRLTKL